MEPSGFSPTVVVAIVGGGRASTILAIEIVDVVTV
jgi:hypothetical protein